MRRVLLLAHVLTAAVPAHAASPAAALAERLLVAISARDAAAVEALLAPDVTIQLPFDASSRTGEADVRALLAASRR